MIANTLEVAVVGGSLLLRPDAKPISVIIGNPPYNANQQNENDNNKNREYTGRL